MTRRAQILRLLFLAATLFLVGSMVLISSFGLWRLRSEAIAWARSAHCSVTATPGAWSTIRASIRLSGL